jgi:hypothetical protein
MMVTQHPASGFARAGRIDLETYWSIVLAVAQWRRHPQLTKAAIVRLTGLGVAPAEIFARRRAASNDPQLAAVLRLAVTIVIAGGRLSAADRRFIERHELDGVADCVKAYADDALAFIAAIGCAARGEIDMNVGDY